MSKNKLGPNIYNRYLHSTWGTYTRTPQNPKDYLIQRLKEHYNVVDIEEDGENVYAVVEADGKQYALSLFIGEIK